VSGVQFPPCLRNASETPSEVGSQSRKMITGAFIGNENSTSALLVTRLVETVVEVRGLYAAQLIYPLVTKSVQGLSFLLQRRLQLGHLDRVQLSQLLPQDLRIIGREILFNVGLRQVLACRVAHANNPFG